MHVAPVYPFWAAAVIGPFVYISAVAHAALWRQISSIVGSIVSFYRINCVLYIHELQGS